MHKKLLYVALVLVCCNDADEDPWKSFSPFTTSYDTYQLEKSTGFTSQGIGVGTIDFTNELSGLAKSKLNDDALWAHADSGNPDLIYLIDEQTGSLKASYHIANVTNDDWEDIAVGPGPKKGQSYIYLGDIGDNNAERSQRLIYRFPEPLYSTLHAGKTIELNIEVEKIIFNYPDGPHDAETLMLDPVHRDLFIVTKYGVTSQLFVARYPQPVNTLFTLTHVGSFPFREATAGDIDSKGQQIAIKNYEQIFYWQNKNNKPIWQVLSQQPMLAPYNPVEAQGEAICFSKNGYYTASEFSNQESVSLYHYPILKRQ
jgi:hypothetical protein